MKSELMQINELIIEDNIKKVGLHIVTPYVGKVRPSLAKYLVSTYCKERDILWDPFCGSGTIPLEGWLKNLNVIATDLNKYAYITTLAKLFPPRNIELVLSEMSLIDSLVEQTKGSIDLFDIPEWVSAFFHPETLKEIISWSRILMQRENWFLLACLLGILHHQRPGFLSYPSSHGVPYLRDKKFPRDQFPNMYCYKNVFERLLKKVKRVLKNAPIMNFDLSRKVLLQNSNLKLNPVIRINTIITSPPYMKALTYARDNRLRLWFLGIEHWKELDKTISPNKKDFIELMTSSFENWSKHQHLGDNCILIIGDLQYSKTEKLSDVMIEIALMNNYHLIDIYDDLIPEIKKSIKGNIGIKSEKICVFKKG